MYTLAHFPNVQFGNLDRRMNRALTNQQQTVYNYIRERIVERGYGPTVREIGDHMNIRSPNGVMCHLRALERKGMITRTKNKSRAIELSEPMSRLFGASLSVDGRVSGGACRFELEPTEQIDLSVFATKDDRFALRVGDDSLLDAQIRSGDLLVVQKQHTAQSGELAIVRTGSTETYIRFWIPDQHRIHLQPVNRSLPPTIVDHAAVLGVIVGVLRDHAPRFQ